MVRSARNASPQKRPTILKNAGLDYGGNGAMSDVERLQRAIRDLHGLESTHLLAIRVYDTFEGKTPWPGLVDVFKIDHPKAQYAFAWSYKDDSGKSHYAAVLGIPPVNSPEDAVRAYIVTQREKVK